MIFIIASMSDEDALRYVLKSMHYGVYLFSDFQGHLQHRGIEHLRGVAASRDGYQRKVILLGSDMRLPGLLADSIYHVFEQQQQETLKPRLRDGRWVVA